MKPPKIVKAPEGCMPWFTPGKEYKVVDAWGKFDDEFGYSFTIIDDEGCECTLSEYEARHFNNHDAIIVSREN